MAVLGWVRENQPGLPVILITAHGTVGTAVEALKRGAHDYITKPFDQHELHTSIVKALAAEETAANWLHEDAGGRFQLIGRTPAMRDLYMLIEKVAPSPTTVLVQGESGTGKELVARALHEHSPRRDGPFIQVHCGSVPESLFDAELFGYEKGAVPGAVSSKPGRYELADRGTLFLDEISEMPREFQVKLLRALQERRIERLGGFRSIEVDVRVVAATHVDLKTAVNEGRFREDLYYRLNVIPIRMPPLRERRDDIPLLVEHFLHKFNDRLGKDVKSATPDALAALLAHDWPGNIRELENLMERSVLLADGDALCLAEMPGLDPAPVPALPEDEVEPGDIDDDMGLKEYVRVHTSKLERARIQRALQAEDGNVTRAARRLGISRKSLQMKMKEYGLRDS
jgi:two-component system, NtrC family, response regulator AtoC